MRSIDPRMRSMSSKSLKDFLAGGSLSDLVAPEEKDEKMEEQKRSRRQRRLARSLRKKLASVAYKGMNRLTLAKDGISPLFASYKQIKDAGDRLSRGSKAASVVYYAPRKKPSASKVAKATKATKANEEKKFVLKRTNVFSMDQFADCQGWFPG